jgi:hypothetical protein
MEGSGGEQMTERAPIKVTNLDRYGSAALPWSRPRDLLAASATSHTTFYLGTVRSDGRPHAAGIGALWHDGDLYIVSGPETRKARSSFIEKEYTNDSLLYWNSHLGRATFA